jgi:hypothetical protein
MNATGLLYLLRDEPTLMDPAPADVDVPAMERRKLDEVHTCLGCGNRARCAVVADTELGPRWLDLCYGCVYEIRKANT